MENYEIFEVIRPNCPSGGSVLTGIHKNLNPVYISGGEDDNEILVVQAKIGIQNCRFINGYGPQEYKSIEERISFYARLEQEVINAKLFDNLVCIEMDANAKLGKECIALDPHPRSSNGDLLFEFCERNNLVICNTTDLCQGTITRQRNTVNGVEKSILDYFIVCQEMFSYLTSMVIDEARAFVLTKYAKIRGKPVVTQSDHNPIICQFNCTWSDKMVDVKQRIEIFNYKDPEGLIRFRELTSSDTLSRCIGSDVRGSGKRWIKEFNNILHRSFKKIRVNKRGVKNEHVHQLMRAKTLISQKISEITENLKLHPESIERNIEILECLQDKVDTLDVEIANISAEKNMKIIKDHYESVTDGAGVFNVPKMWGLKKKLKLQSSDVPSAKKDASGNLVTTKNGLLSLYKSTYMDRLSHKPIRPEYEELKQLKEKLFELRFQISSLTKSEDWDQEKVEKICKSLKNSKARDESGLIYELFKPPYAGNDVYESLAKLFSLSKQELDIPEFFEKMSITSLYKNKGVRSSLANERGIFNLSKVRSIFDKVRYSDIYDTIDQNMSFSNVGGRKHRNIRDHLFVVNAAVNNVINGDGKSFDIQGFDVVKCFDEMWYEETLNDMWDVKIQDDKFALISKLDNKCKIVVKTPSGVTDMFELSRIVLQGSVLGPIKCSVQMDTIGRESLRTGLGIYKYKDTVDIPSLAMIDDIMAISACGDDTIELNAIINAKIEAKKLRLSEDKCYKIHICKKTNECSQNLKVHDGTMKTVKQATYLGDVICENGMIDETISQRCQKSFGIITQISSLLSSISLGNFHFDIAMVLRESQFINSVMVNSEIWHNVMIKHTLSLEQMDLDLLRKILSAHSKTAAEAFYFELGKYPLRFVWAKRRFMYLWQILHRDTDELVRKVYETQKLKPCKGDWFTIMQNERSTYELEISDSEISKISEYKFRKIIQEKINKQAIKYLEGLASKHMKSTQIAAEGFGKKDYFNDNRFSKEDIQLLFALRTKMTDCKSNFSNQYGNNLTCRLCQELNSVEDEDHILRCKKLNTEDYNASFADVYENIDKQYVVTQIYKKVLRKRNLYLEAMKHNPSMDGPVYQSTLD